MRECHPYGEYFPKRARAMIVGTFPIGKFSHPGRREEIKPHEMDFFFGGEKNLLWKLLSEVFATPLSSKVEVVSFLEKKGLALGDVIRSCRRKSGGGSDSDLYDIEWNEELLKKIHEHHISTVYFTSKKVEQLFNRLFPDSSDLTKITLISPSGQSIRSLYHRSDFVKWLKKHPDEKKMSFIIEDYRAKFKTMI